MLYNRASEKQLHKKEITIGSIKREFSFYLPKQLAKHPGIVFVIHGSGSTSKDMQILTGFQFDKLADKYKDFIVVYPQSYEKYWNDCRKESSFISKKMNIDEIAYFEKMIDYLSETFSINKSEVFASGFSNGGQMCYKLAKEIPDKFKGISAVCSNLPVETNNDCYEKNLPVSIIIINGNTDPYNPYNGGEVIVGDNQKRGSILSTSRTIDYWLNINKCDTLNKKIYNFPDLDKTDNSTAISFVYRSSITNKKVGYIKVNNGGHIFPNPAFTSWSKELGNVNRDVNAPEIIIEFFRGL